MQLLIALLPGLIAKVIPLLVGKAEEKWGSGQGPRKLSEVTHAALNFIERKTGKDIPDEIEEMLAHDVIPLAVDIALGKAITPEDWEVPALDAPRPRQEASPTENSPS